MRAGQRVHLRLRAEILNGDLAPGAPLGEVELSERFGTSRTPVRETLGLLAADGPCLMHVIIDPKDNVWPLVPPGKSNADMMEGS